MTNTIAYHCWHDHDEIALVQMEQLSALGCNIVPFQRGAPIPPDAPVVLTNGPFGSLAPLSRQLEAIPSSRRPRFALWMSEQFWNPRIPGVAGRTLGSLWAAIDRQITGSQWPGITFAQRLLQHRANRFRYFGELKHLQNMDTSTTIIVHSAWIARFMADNGIKADVAVNGYSPHWGHPQGLERNVSVLWLGKTGSRRRQRLLVQVRRQLGQRDVEMLVIDGHENPYTFGAERTLLLNRTKIVLNLLRQPWDSNYLRYMLAMSNGALVVGEPTYTHTPLENGKHLVISDVGSISDAICYYLENDTERDEIALNAFEFISTSFTMRDGARHVLRSVGIT